MAVAQCQRVTRLLEQLAFEFSVLEVTARDHVIEIQGSADNSSTSEPVSKAAEDIFVSDSLVATPLGGPRSPPVDFVPSSTIFGDGPQGVENRDRTSTLDPFSLSKVGRIVQSKRFEQTSLLLIGLNALWTGHQSEEATKEQGEHPWTWFQLDNLFCACFSLEAFVRIQALSVKMNGFKDPWLVVDVVVVFSMIVETCMVALLDFGHSMSMQSIFPVVRMAKLIHLLRIPEMVHLLHGLYKGTRSVFSAFLLTLMILYVFGVAVTNMTAGSSVGDQYFKSVSASVWNLFFRVAMADEIGEFVAEVYSHDIMCWFLCVCVLMLTNFIMMNMLIGIVCDVIREVAMHDRETMDLKSIEGVVKKELINADINVDGQLSRDEFLNIIEQPDVITAFVDANIDVRGLATLSDTIFQSDKKGKCFDAHIHVDQMLDIVMAFRGKTPVTLKDILLLRKSLTEHSSRQIFILDALLKNQHSIQSEVLNNQHMILEGDLEIQKGQTNAHAQLAGQMTSVVSRAHLTHEDQDASLKHAGKGAEEIYDM